MRFLSADRRNAFTRLPLCLSALALGLTACGGDSNSPPAADAPTAPPPVSAAPPAVQTLAGSVDTGSALPAGVIVCADRDSNLVCGTGEESAAVDTGGGWSLGLNDTIDPATLTVLAQFPAGTGGSGAGAEAAVLVAPGNAGVISGLTTLEWASQPAATTPEARTTWLHSLGLTAPLDPRSTTDPLTRQLNAALAPALIQVQQSPQGQANPAPGATSKTESLRQGGQAIAATIPRYVDAGTGTLLATVGAHTFATEARYAVRGNTDCMAPQIVATVRIDTAGGVPITSKEDYVQATVSITGTDGSSQQLATQIRGRGNSTWNMPKKPYRLKLAEKTALLGMDSNRDWAMLANYADMTLMRNAVALCLGRMFDFDFTPDYRYIELTLNGDYVGIYQVTDQVEVGTDRVNIDEAVQGDTDQDLAFLAEIDAHFAEEKFWFQSPRQIPYVIKSEITAAQVPLINTFITQLETALFGPDFLNPQTGYTRYLDTEAAIDFYLVNEILRNNDVFYSSTYAHRQRGGKLRFGPLWDFDLAAGNYANQGNDQPIGWWVHRTSAYYGRLVIDDPLFRQQLKARWAYLHKRMTDIQTFIASGAQNLDAAQTRNYTRWPTLGTVFWPVPATYYTYPGEVAHLSGWLTTRTNWIDEQFRTQPNAPAQ